MTAQYVPITPMEISAPNKILFVQGLPHNIAQETLAQLFRSYVLISWHSVTHSFPGFKEVRMVPARPGIAFVEYEDENRAGTAMVGLKGHKIDDTHPIQVNYAKK